MTDRLFGGVEGGATHTNVMILNAGGDVLASVSGKGTNQWLEGIPAVADTLHALFAAAKKQAQLPVDTQLESVGLCMSGFEQEAPQLQLIEAFKAQSAPIARTYRIMNDSVGSVFSVSPDGGIVVISGTGSIAQRIDAEGRSSRCGGWGHMFGDEGSAYYIASKAVRLAFRHRDGYSTDPHGKVLLDAAPTRKIIQEYFELESIDDILEVFYRSFDKARIANLTRHLAQAASNGDAFCIRLFHNAGRHLGHQVRSLLYPSTTSVSASASTSSDSSTALPPPAAGETLTCLCVGSVWKSFPLLRSGFEEALLAVPTGSPSFSLQLLLPKVSGAVGAAYVAAKKEVGVDLDLDFASNAEPLHTIHVSRPYLDIDSSNLLTLVGVAASIAVAGFAILSRRRS